MEAKTALLFPGQGSQYVGMAKSFYEDDQSVRELFDTIDCSFDIKELILNGPAEDLRETRYSQACIFLVSLAIANSLKDMGLKVDAVAGLSLGEYSALSFAGAFSVQEGIDLLEERGRIMADYIPKNTGMSVIVALDHNEVQASCAEASMIGACEIASYVAPGRTVITGDLGAVARAMELCKEKGARMVMPVEASGAFHSILAKDAAREFEGMLASFEMGNPAMPVYYNFDGTDSCDDIKAMEAGQLYNSVQFVKTIENMCKDGITRFIAVGPGSTLAGFARDTAKSQGISIKTHVVETHDDALKLMNNIEAIS